MDYPGVRFLSNLRAPPTAVDNPELAPESVDLLQMVPETSRVAPQQPRYAAEDSPAAVRAPEHETQPRRMRVLLVQDEEGGGGSGTREEVTDLRGNSGNVDSDSGIGSHICQNCSREGSIYYNRQGELGHYECRNNHDTTRDGSVYFNYLQFANRSRTQTLPNHSLLGNTSNYEPIDRGASLDRVNNKKAKTLKPPKPPKPPKPKVANNSKQRSVSSCRNFVFNCCKSNNVRQNAANSAKSGNKGKCNKQSIEDGIYGSSIYQHQQGSSSPSSPAILNNNRARKRSEWSRVKRLLFLVGVLLGILVALGGIVVGFVVLAPHKNKAGTCVQPGTIRCDDIGCVTIKAFCLGKITCHNIAHSDVCLYNATGDALPANSETKQEPEVVEVVTFTPNFEKPIKDEEGWVYFSQGSAAGGSRYTVINRSMLFSAAQEECRSRGGHLAHVNSIREQIFLEDYLTQELENSDIRKGGVGFWLGARRQRGSHSGTCLYDQWKWVDVYNREHGVIKGFTAFMPDKPDNLYSPEECLFLSYKEETSDSFLKWDDAPCDIQSVGSFKVLCEVEDR